MLGTEVTEFPIGGNHTSLQISHPYATNWIHKGSIFSFYGFGVAVKEIWGLLVDFEYIFSKIALSLGIVDFGTKMTMLAIVFVYLIWFLDFFFLYKIYGFLLKIKSFMACLDATEWRGVD